MPGKPAGPPAIVALPVEIDLTNHAVAAASLLDALDNIGLVIADMSGTTFCDSAGLRMLFNAHQHASASGSTLRIVIRPGSSVARSLAILGMDRVLPIYASLEEALPAHFGTSQPTQQASGQPGGPVPWRDEEAADPHRGCSGRFRGVAEGPGPACRPRSLE